MIYNHPLSTKRWIWGYRQKSNARTNTQQDLIAPIIIFNIHKLRVAGPSHILCFHTVYIYAAARAYISKNSKIRLQLLNAHAMCHFGNANWSLTSLKRLSCCTGCLQPKIRPTTRGTEDSWLSLLRNCPKPPTRLCIQGTPATRQRGYTLEVLSYLG